MYHVHVYVCHFYTINCLVCVLFAPVTIPTYSFIFDDFYICIYY